MRKTFSYVRYDNESAAKQQGFKKAFEEIETQLSTLKDGRAKSLVITNLEVAYMWVGKAIRDEQIERDGKVVEDPKRGEEPPTPSEAPECSPPQNPKAP